MDDNLLKDLDYFAAPSAQASNSVEQDVEQSRSSVTPKAAETSLWEGLRGDAGISESASAATSSASLLSFAQPSTAPTNASRGSISGSSFLGQSKSTLLAGAAPASSEPGKRHKHDRKRVKVAPEPSVLDSVDYWIQFDDDDQDSKLGESFEIDFSKRNTGTRNVTTPSSRLNPLSTTPGLGTGLYTSSIFKDDDFADDSALDNALSDDEELIESMNLGEQLSSIDTQPPADVPPREGLYSTPLSWERPQAGLRMDSLFGIGNPMFDAEQRKLLAIALNTGKPSSFGSEFSFGPGADFESEFSSSLGAFGPDRTTTSMSEISKVPEKAMPPPPSRGKNTTADWDTKPAHLQRSNTGLSDKSKDKGKAGDRTTHNDIEKKYRTNLKDRIAELRDAIPSLKSLPDEGAEEEEAESQSRGPPKVSKGTVLTKATEYIHHLEKKNRAIMREHQELARRLQAFEQLLNASARQPFPMPIYSRTLFDPRGFC